MLSFTEFLFRWGKENKISPELSHTPSLHMHLAVIDCGTNIFHLLLMAVGPDGVFREVAQEQAYVYLAEEGIATMGERPFRRGIEALQQFRRTMAPFGTVHVKAVGTAALRTASNGEAFIEAALREAGISIELIDGEEEAKLICLGVRQAVPLDDRPVLIMDIGGGSVEYIVTNRERIFWARSLPIGVSVLFHQFQHSDPLSSADVAAATAHLNAMLEPLAEACAQFAPVAMVGASGTFDVLDRMLADSSPEATWSEIPLEGFRSVHDRLVYGTAAERAAMPELPPVRARLIAMAMVLIQVSLRLSGCPKLLYSRYALKQGLMGELVRNAQTARQ
jgi:exopolyphosphatase/guanosine-5'-triphosphate,3'-diphosphate pyrophosphatase